MSASQRDTNGSPLPCFMPFGNCMLSYSFTISELLYTYVKMYKRFLNGRNPIALDFMFSFFRWLYLCFWRCFKFYGDRFVIHLSFLGVSSIFKIALYIFFIKDMRISENYVDCAKGITVSRSMSSIRRLTLIFTIKHCVSCD